MNCNIKKKKKLTDCTDRVSGRKSIFTGLGIVYYCRHLSCVCLFVRIRNEDPSEGEEGRKEKLNHLRSVNPHTKDLQSHNIFGLPVSGSRHR